MKVKTDIVLKNFAGDASLKDEKNDDLTLKTVCVSALLNQTNDKVGGFEKYKCWQLATKFKDAQEIILKAEEVTVIKQLVDKMFNALIVGQVYDILEGDTEN